MSITAEWRAVTLKAAAGDLFALEHEGRGDLSPLVLLHGAGGNSRAWTGISPAFADRRVLLVDMPGHGQSAAAGTWELGETTAHVAGAVRRLLGGARPVWGGHSWGGKVAGLIAALDPFACAGLALFDPSPSAAVPFDIEAFVEKTWGVELRAYASPQKAAVSGRQLRQWQPWDDQVEAAFMHGLARRKDGSWSLRPGRADLVALATAVLHADADEQLARASSVPTLLLVASESLSWQETTNMALYTAATRQVIAGHHWIHVCNRESVISALAPWLAARA